MMDNILAGLPFYFVYQDDILVASSSHQQHLEHVEAMLVKLKEHGLVLNQEKCVLRVDQVDYLSHNISS